MSILYVTASGGLRKVSVTGFFGSKTRFVSIMVTTPKNAILRFVFSKLPRAKGKMDISWDNQKCPKNGGIITLRRFWPSADLNEKIFEF
jgi:hypothetical protein